MNAALLLRVLRHVLFWLALWGFFLLIQLPEHVATGRKIFWREYLFMQLPLSLVTIYPLLYGLLPRLLGGRQLGRVLAGLAGGLVAVAGLSGLLESFYRHAVLPGLYGEPAPPPFGWQEITRGLNFGFFALVLIAGVASAIKGVSHWHEQQRLGLELQQQRLRTELQLLKAQLQPPFLFRTLHLLHELTRRKSPAAPAAVLHLSALLRYLLYESPLDAAPLADEVEMMRHYVALEKLRLGAGVDVSLTVSGELAAHTVAPLLLLPLLENAFRHGTGAGQECPWVNIDLVGKPRSLTCKIINSRAPADAEPGDGPGLGALRQRLARLYPGRHELKIVAEPDTFLVTLHLRLAPQAAPPAPVVVALPVLAGVSPPLRARRPA